MIKYLHLSLLCLFIPAFIFAQQFEVSVASGFAGSSMNDLKTMNEKLIRQLPFEARVVNDFPAWLIYRVSVVSVIHDRYKIGVVYHHSSTGSRVSSADYSGEYHFDIGIKGNSVGLLFGYEAFRLKQFDIRVNAMIGGVFTSCKFDEYLQMYGDVQTDASSMKSSSVYVSPEVALNYRFGIFGAGIFGGFLYDTGGLLILSGQKTTTFTNWTGFSAGIAMNVRFALKKSAEPAKR